MDCADLIRNDKILLPSRLSTSRPMLRAILIQLRDLSILIVFMLAFLFLLKLVFKREIIHREKPLDILLKEQGQTNPP